MADIFLSYSKMDRARVKPLAEEFERRGYTVWWDRHVPPGSTWAQLVEEELDGAGCVVVVWSKASVLSEWVDIEAARAKRRRVLVPAMIDDVADDIPLEFSRLQAARLVDWEQRKDESDFELLINTIEKTLRRSTTPDAGKQKIVSELPASESAGPREAAWEDRRPLPSPFADAAPKSHGFVWRRLNFPLVGAGAAVLLVGMMAAVFFLSYYASLPTYHDVVGKYAARVDARRSQLRTIAAGLPPKGSVQDSTCGQPLDPPPTYNEGSKLFNTEFLMDWELTREHLESPAGKYDLYLSPMLDAAISWRLGSLDESARRQKDWKGEFAQKFEQALSARYLVVNRVFDDPRSYGKLRVETFIADLDSAKQICSFAFSVEGGDMVFHSSQFRSDLSRRLTEATGGAFSF